MMNRKTEEFPNGYPRLVAESIAEGIQQDQAILRFAYKGKLGEFKEEQGRLIVPVHVMTPGENVNRWGVTEEARRRCAESLKDATLLGVPDQDHPGTVSGGPPGAPHEGEWYPLQGRIIDYVTNGVTYGIASIEDEYAIQKIKSREWGPVSPAIMGIAHFEPNGTKRYTDFLYDHILFLPPGTAPAYPRAGVKSWSEVPDNFTDAAQAALDNFTVTPKGETDADMKALRPSPARRTLLGMQGFLARRKGVQTLKDPIKAPEEMEKVLEDHVIRMAALEEKFETLSKNQTPAAAKKEGEPEPKDAEKPSQDQAKEITVLKEKIKAFETFQNAVVSRDHAKLVDSVLEAQKHANLNMDAKAIVEERKRLDTLPDQALVEVLSTLTKAAAMLKSLPNFKAPEAFEETDQAADVHEKIRMQMYGERWDKDGNPVTGKEGE